MKENSHAEFVARRAELMAQLFLQDIEAVSIARPAHELGYDLMVSFLNSKGGINTFGVVVKATERPIESPLTIKRSTYDRLAHSTPPGLLLVADVKHNRLFYAWPPRASNGEGESKNLRVPLTEVDVKSKKDLHKKLAA